MKAGNLFHIRGPATSDDLSPGRVLVRGTTHDNAAEDQQTYGTEVDHVLPHVVMFWGRKVAGQGRTLKNV